ncbi:hypothetical protein LC55x_5390 [Lysobacter capsici]|nr:hypothetical protein LC55x_5390 [Lysobacter capsici]
MRGEGCRRQIELIAQFANSHARWSGLHERAIRSKAMIMGERTKRLDGLSSIHISTFPEYRKYCGDLWQSCDCANLSN